VKNPLISLATTATLLACLSVPAFAQGAMQTLSVMTIDTTTLQSGYRASKVIGAKVVNEAKEVVGKIDDLIITPTEKVPFAIISVGGFLGVGSKYVVIQASSLEIHSTTILLPGATKEALKALPPYTYAK